MKNISIPRTMFFNRHNTLFTSHYGLLLAGLLLRSVFALHPASLLRSLLALHSASLRVAR